MWAVVDGVEHRKNRTAWVSDYSISLELCVSHSMYPALARTDMLHALSQHHLMEYLASCHTHEAMVHLRLSEGLEGLYVSEPPIVAAIESGTWDGSLR